MKRLHLKKLFLTAIVLMCFATGQAQITAKNTNNTVGSDSTRRMNDFPVFVNTGNPEADRARYDAQKQEWIRNNPEKYRQMQSSNNSKQHISKSKFDSLSEEQRQYILIHPELYIVE